MIDAVRRLVFRGDELGWFAPDQCFPAGTSHAIFLVVDGSEQRVASKAKAEHK